MDLENFISNCWRDVKAYLIKEAGMFQSPRGENEEEAAQSEADNIQDGDEHDEEGTSDLSNSFKMI